jgi:hypothetical protein
MGFIRVPTPADKEERVLACELLKDWKGVIQVEAGFGEVFEESIC